MNRALGVGTTGVRYLRLSTTLANLAGVGDAEGLGAEDEGLREGRERVHHGEAQFDR